MATPGRQIDPESIIPQQTCADQDLVAAYKRRLCSNHPVIEWEIDPEDIYLDSLIDCQKGYHAANELLRSHAGVIAQAVPAHR